MFKFAVFVIVTLSVWCGHVMAQQTPLAESRRAILVLDASGSMWGQIDGKNKIVIAREVVNGLMADWDANIDLGLMAYGHRSEGDCEDIELLVPVAKRTQTRITEVVNHLNPKGKTPITAAVRQAALELQFEDEPATVILITDGLETCNANPCALAEELEAKGIDFTAHVIGFDVSPDEGRQLKCIADNTGGQYYSAGNATELEFSLTSIVKALPMEDPAAIDLLLVQGGEPITSPYAMWDFFPAANGARVGNTKIATFWGYKGFARLDNGQYLAHIKVGQVESDFSFELTESGARSFQAVLNAGLLRLRAMMGESAARHASKVHWQIFAADDQGNASGPELGYDFGLATEFVIKPGAYLVTIKAEGARTSAIFDVEAGDEVEKEFDLRAGELTFDAVLTPGAEPEDGYFAWEVFSRGSDGLAVSGRLTNSYGKRGRFLLAAGDYLLDVKAGATTRQVPVSVMADETQHVHTSLDAGYVDYSAVLTEAGEPVQSPSYRWEVRSMMGADPALLAQKAYAYGGGGSFLLPVGEYVLRFKGDAFDREEMLIVTPGARTEVKMMLNAGIVDFEILDESGVRLLSSVSWGIHEFESGQKVLQGFGVAGKVVVPEGRYEFRIASGGRSASVPLQVVAGKTVAVQIPTTKP